MIVERKDDEIIVRLSPKTNTEDLQDMIDYLEYKELVSRSKANESDINNLTKEVNQSMMTIVRETRK